MVRPIDFREDSCVRLYPHTPLLVVVGLLLAISWTICTLHTFLALHGLYSWVLPFLARVALVTRFPPLQLIIFSHVFTHHTTSECSTKPAAEGNQREFFALLFVCVLKRDREQGQGIYLLGQNNVFVPCLPPSILQLVDKGMIDSKSRQRRTVFLVMQACIQTGVV